MDNTTELKLTLNRRVSLSELHEVSHPGGRILLADEVQKKVEETRIMLETMVAQGRVIYGVNTSMGGFVNYLVPTTYAEKLQLNLLNAVATNVGSYVPDRIVRMIIAARIVSLSRGHSAITLANLKKLVDLFNAGIIPCIPEKGSLGTSGDLGPLAAIALVCVGQGKAFVGGVLMDGASALQKKGLPPMQLSYKEGLALINGTSGMVGYGTHVVCAFRFLLDQYLKISGLSLEALLAKKNPFAPRVHQLKPHPGQQRVAEILSEYISDSKMAQDDSAVEKVLSTTKEAGIHPESESIEDAYSVRCTPQILGPVLDALNYVSGVVENELNSSNDNPLIIAEDNEVYHNGHFHGQYVSMAMDSLNVAMVTLCNLADRRIDRFLTKANSNGLPAFLCAENPGLRLGLMGGQFMSSSLTAENRSLATPISIQTLPTTGDFQDIVSLGFVACRRADEILKNTRYIVAFEAICACQAADIRGLDRLSRNGRHLHDTLRAHVPYLSEDKTLSDYLEQIVSHLLS